MDVKSVDLAPCSVKFPFPELSDIDLRILEARLTENRYQFLELVVDVLSIIIRNEIEHISKKSRISRQLLKIGKEYGACEPSDQLSLWLKVIYVQLVEVASKNSKAGTFLLYDLTSRILSIICKKEPEVNPILGFKNVMLSMTIELNNELEKFLSNVNFNNENEIAFLYRQRFLLMETFSLFISDSDNV